jgi:hypothetical protein
MFWVINRNAQREPREAPTEKEQKMGAAPISLIVQITARIALHAVPARAATRTALRGQKQADG